MADDKLRDLNPNPTPEDYLKEQDIRIRMFCVKQATKFASKREGIVDINKLSQIAYDFITAKT